MKQIKIKNPLHGFPQGAILWVYPKDGVFYLIEDFKNPPKNQRTINPKDVQYDYRNY